MDLLLFDSDSYKFKSFDLEGFIERISNKYKKESDTEELKRSTIVFRDLEYLGIEEEQEFLKSSLLDVFN